MSPGRARGVIVVLAKAPEPGQVKTRMCPPLQPREAAELYARLLEDVLEATAAFSAALDLAPRVAVHPGEACAHVARVAPRSFSVVRQRGPDLAARMTSALREACAAGFERVLLRGSDSPLLDGEQVGAALAALDDVDVVVSPDRDGGYNLVGVRRPVAGLFDHEMSTASVLERTLENARRAGLRSRRLETGFDLDTAEDLALLAAARSPRAERLCPRTFEFLDARELWRSAQNG